MRILEFIPDPFVNALAWSILHAVWQIVVIALLWRIALYFSRKAPARLRQNLSLLALLAIPTVFLFTFFRQYNSYAGIQKIAYLEFESTAGETLYNAPGNYFLLAAESNPFTGFIEANALFIFWLYWLGTGLFSLYFLLSYTRMLQLRKDNLHAVPEVWNPVILKAQQQTQLKRKISVFLSARVTVPVVTGIFKPIVLFPLAVSASMSMQEVEEILLHEYYHIKCNDHYLHALQSIIEILFFFHPGTWWISNHLRLEREARVDEWVVLQTRDPLNYARTLLSLEENRNTRLQPALAATQSGSSLLTRIKNIMHMKTRKFKTGQKIAALLVIIVAAVSLAWLSPPSFISMNFDGPEHAITSIPAAEEPSEPIVQSTPPSEPSRIVMESGESVTWQQLSEADKAEIRNAMEEARVAIREAMREVQTELNSEETRRELQNAREEIKRAMEEVNRELSSEEFKAEMRQAREEVRRAMEEVNNLMQSEEFRTEMQQVSRELNQAMQELNKIEWDKVAVGINQAMQEVGKSMEALAPALEEMFKNLNFEELFKELEEAGKE